MKTRLIRRIKRSFSQTSKNTIIHAKTKLKFTSSKNLIKNKKSLKKIFTKNYKTNITNITSLITIWNITILFIKNFMTKTKFSLISFWRNVFNHDVAFVKKILHSTMIFIDIYVQNIKFLKLWRFRSLETSSQSLRKKSITFLIKSTKMYRRWFRQQTSSFYLLIENFLQTSLQISWFQRVLFLRFFNSLLTFSKTSTLIISFAIKLM